MWNKNWLYQRPPEKLDWSNAHKDSLDSTSNTFHDALLEILDKRKISERNVSLLEKHLWVIALQELLDRAQRENMENMGNKAMKKYINDVRSRIIQTLKELDLSYSLSSKRTINQGETWDIREININHVFISDLRKKINS